MQEFLLFFIYIYIRRCLEDRLGGLLVLGRLLMHVLLMHWLDWVGVEGGFHWETIWVATRVLCIRNIVLIIGLEIRVALGIRVAILDSERMIGLFPGLLALDLEGGVEC